MSRSKPWTEKEAAKVVLVYAPDWPDKMTLIRDENSSELHGVEQGLAEIERGETLTLAELRADLAERRPDS